MSVPPLPAALPNLFQLWGRLNAVLPESGQDTRGLPGLSEATFRAIMFEELLGRTQGAQDEPADPATEAQGLDAASAPQAVEAGAPSPETGEMGRAATEPSASAPPVPARETALIAQEAARTGVDPALLAAIRRTERGGPGRETAR